MRITKEYEFKGKLVQIVSGSQGYFYRVNGKASVVRSYGDSIAAQKNAEHDIKMGYWEEL